MKFHLSNAQKKELRNGKMLTIALPIEPAADDLDNLQPLIRSLMDLPEGVHVIRPIESIIRVDPRSRATGLASVLGEILQEERPGWLELSVNVISFHLSARRETRGTYPHQWPGSVTLDSGRTLPERDYRDLTPAERELIDTARAETEANRGEIIAEGRRRKGSE
jgi:hypothetical protein